MSVKEKYETVIGLEVHAQLLTKTKAYSSFYWGMPFSVTTMLNSCIKEAADIIAVAGTAMDTTIIMSTANMYTAD